MLIDWFSVGELFGGGGLGLSPSLKVDDDVLALDVDVGVAGPSVSVYESALEFGKSESESSDGGGSIFVYPSECCSGSVSASSM